MAPTVSMVNTATKVKNNIDKDFRSGALNCSEYENVCVFDAEKFKNVTGKDLTLGEIKQRYDIPDGKLTKGEAGEMNNFYMHDFGTGSYDDEKPSDLTNPFRFYKNLFTGKTPVYIPKNEITEH